MPIEDIFLRQACLAMAMVRETTMLVVMLIAAVQVAPEVKISLNTGLTFAFVLKFVELILSPC